MLNLDALDTIIAIVVVLLILSLLVQSIQSLVKKLLKLKSREIEKSLLILFENVIEKEAQPKASGAGVPAVGAAAAAAAPEVKRATPEELVGKVLEQFKAIGRTTKFKNPVLESISKEDLLKVLARIESRTLHSGYVEKFEGLYEQVKSLEERIEALVNGNLLQGAASAKFAEMREVLSPLINDFKAIVSGGSVKQEVLLGDLLALREIKLEDALALLSSAQEAVAKDLEAERAAKNDAAVGALQELSKALTEIARIIGQLGQRADEAFGALRARLDHVANWYDTAMQSFEERYNRSMKNVAIYISIPVVIFFNANIFRIYRNISTDELQRSLIVKAGEKFLDEQRNGNANANGGGDTGANTNANAAQGNLNAAATPNANAGAGNSNAAASGNSNAATNVNSNTAAANNASNANRAANSNSGGAAGKKLPQAVVDLGQNLKVINDYTSKYRSFGFAPLTMDHLKFWWGTVWMNPLRVQWWINRLVDIKRLLGWALTVLLLSVGAPFWQDTLESLFGVKNLLRKKSDTRNVEGRSGEGQTRS